MITGCGSKKEDKKEEKDSNESNSFTRDITYSYDEIFNDVSFFDDSVCFSYDKNDEFYSMISSVDFLNKNHIGISVVSGNDSIASFGIESFNSFKDVDDEKSLSSKIVNQIKISDNEIITVLENPIYGTLCYYSFEANGKVISIDGTCDLNSEKPYEYLEKARKMFDTEKSCVSFDKKIKSIKILGDYFINDNASAIARASLISISNNDYSGYIYLKDFYADNKYVEYTNSVDKGNLEFKWFDDDILECTYVLITNTDSNISIGLAVSSYDKKYGFTSDEILEIFDEFFTK